MTATEHKHSTDPAGLQTLEQFAAAGHFNRWLFQTIRPWCKGHLLEVGSGIGNLSSFFLENQFMLTASDLREEYCRILQQKFGGHPQLEGVVHLDLSEPGITSNRPELANRFDTIIALNVVEHIEDDSLAILNCRQMLKPGGHLVVLVPAWQFLYNQFDKELGHFKRYTRRSLKALLAQQQLEVTGSRYFNAVGIIGWWLDGTLLRKRMIPPKQLQVFNKLVPLVRCIDTLSFNAIGLSVIAAGRKPI